MGQSALEMVSGITPLLLGFAGICACIALAMAIGRHFLYEHDDLDLQPATKRITHVFGFLAAIGFVSVGGMNMAKKWAEDAAINPAINGSGTSMVPEGASKGSGYSNIGDLIMNESKGKITQEFIDGAKELGSEFEKAYIAARGEEGAQELADFKAKFNESGGEEFERAFKEYYGEDKWNALMGSD